MTKERFMNELKVNRWNLTKKQFAVLKGQALSGDVEGALRGLDKILRKKWE